MEGERFYVFSPLMCGAALPAGPPENRLAAEAKVLRLTYGEGPIPLSKGILLNS